MEEILINKKQNNLNENEVNLSLNFMRLFKSLIQFSDNN